MRVKALVALFLLFMLPSIVETGSQFIAPPLDLIETGLQ